ncbi:hypothetical protein [Nonomuraea sp. SBT364]|uniref:hypothetical protein n=1 Tax=Nonomuraea sp. SBT364 TaxID=1580530 RepID=UPI00066AF4BD|nr:hypothetical protein [Nonomuraea sp. SBT364]
MSDPDGGQSTSLELAPNFPGLEADGRGPYVDHQGVRSALSRLRRQLETLRGSAPAGMSATWSGPGTIGQVAGLSNVGSSETGPWQVASGFGENTATAYTVFNGSYSDFLDCIEQWAAAIEKAIDNYERGHAASSA